MLESKEAMRVSVLAIACLALAGCANSSTRSARASAADTADIGTMIYVEGASVRDYRPQPALVTPVHEINRARYPAVDIHCHWTLDADPASMLAAMNERNVARAVNLSGGWGQDLELMLARFRDRAPDRFIIFCNIDFSRIDEPGFGATMAEFLRAARDRGAAGLKIFKDLGLRIRDASGRLVPVDDPRLDPIWAACGELDMPVLIHTADPIAFFRPINRFNERWMQLARHPDWSFFGPGFPLHDEVLAQRNRMMRRHPRTRFIGAHVGGYAEDIAAARRALDEHPNFFVDISGRVAELGRQPYAARRFFLDYPDRILFGTDRFPGRPDQPRYRIYFRFLETADEHFDYYDHPFPPTGDWRINGVYLPDAVLRKVYHENADRLLEPPPSE